MSDQDLSRFVFTNATKRLSYVEAAVEVMDCLCVTPLCQTCQKLVRLQPVASPDGHIDVLRICDCSSAGLHIYAKCPRKSEPGPTALEICLPRFFADVSAWASKMVYTSPIAREIEARFYGTFQQTPSGHWVFATTTVFSELQQEEIATYFERLSQLAAHWE